MNTYQGFDASDLKRTQRVLAVGAFDGVHRGHQRLLGHVCRTATEYGVESAIMTFEPIPAQVFRSEEPRRVRLTLSDERERVLAQQRVDTAIVVEFSEDFRNMPAVEFAREVLVARLGVIALVASKTHTFGRNAEADVRRITELGMEFGFEVHVLPPILVEGERINSGDIRRRLWEGDVQGAADWLGRQFDLAGEVVPGRGVGRKIGFPTANLRPHPDKLIPGDGVYACAARVELNGEAQSDWLPAAVNIGEAPTIGDGARSIEAHLVDTEGIKLAGRWLRLLFLSRLRGQEAFEDTRALAQQIARDVHTVRDEFATMRAGATVV